MNLLPLFELSRQLLRQLNRPVSREVGNWPSVKRLLVTGQRGVGKSTWIAQQIIREFPEFEQSKKCLYLPIDHFRVSGLSIYEIAEEFSLRGGELLCLDEIHRASHWSRELKSIADTFPDLRVLASGSSLLQLQRGSHDISRRYLATSMRGLSFREFLQIRHSVQNEAIPLKEVLLHHERHAARVIQVLKKHKLQVLECFSRYLTSGVYPYSFELDDTVFIQTLQQSVAITIECDLPAIHPTLTGASIQRIRRLLGAVARNVPFSPDLSKLRRLLHIADDRTLKEYLAYLEEARLLIALRREGTPFRSMDKPDRIYLGDPNLATALASPEEPDIGSRRETFLLNSLPDSIEARAADQGDFLIQNRFTLEVGGRNKDSSQIRDIPDAYLALDGIPSGSGTRVPLWLFGFLR